MMLKRAARSLFLAVFSMGYPDYGYPPDVDPDGMATTFALQGNYLPNPVEAGVWGELAWIRSSPEWINLPRSKAILQGLGHFYYVSVERAPDFETTHRYIPMVTPWEEIADTYYSNGMYLYYRPPSNDEVPPEGVDVAFACEVLNPVTNKWDRSPDYARRVVRRDKPMRFYLSPSLTITDLYQKYGPDNSFSEATMAPGETYTGLGLETSPVPPEDIQLQVSLSGPDGYMGPLGEIEMTWEEFNYYQPDTRGYDYTAPADLAKPVDIVATFSVYDPWTKERRTRELTFHVVPKD